MREIRLIPGKALYLTAAIVSVLFATGCGKDEIKVYRIPKDNPHAGHAHHDHASHGKRKSPHGKMPKNHKAKPKVLPLKWAAPKEWQSLRNPTAIRIATYRIQGRGDEPGADISIVTFAAGHRKLIDFVNLWRNELGVGETTADQLPKLTETIRTGLGPAQLITVGGLPSDTDKTKQQILVALFDHENLTWFIKMTGPKTVLAENKMMFKAFVRTFEETKK